MAEYTGVPTGGRYDTIINTIADFLPSDPNKPIVAMPQSRFEAWEELVSMKEEGDIGHKCEIRAIINTSKSTVKQSRYFNPGQTRTATLTTGTAVGEVPYANLGFEIAWVDDQLRSQPSGKKIVDELKRITIQKTSKFLHGLDADVMDLPASDSLAPTDGTAVELFGYPYWGTRITAAQNAVPATSAGAFQGANPTGFSKKANIDLSSSTYALLRNYCAGWGNSTGALTEEGIMRLAEMFYQMNFVVPEMLTDYKAPQFRNKQLLAGRTVIENIKKYARAQKDNMSGDVGELAGTAIMFGTPVKRIQALDSDVYNTLYMVNKDLFKFRYDPGRWFYKREPITPDKQPDTRVIYVETKGQLILEDMQKGIAVMSLPEN